MIGSVVHDSVIFFIKKLPVFVVTIILSFDKLPDDTWDDNDKKGQSTNYAIFQICKYEQKKKTLLLRAG